MTGQNESNVAADLSNSKKTGLSRNFRDYACTIDKQMIV